MKYSRMFLICLGLSLAGTAIAPAQYGVLPVTLTLDPPAGAAPGVNNLEIELDGGALGVETDNSEITGTIEAVFLLDLSDPDNPVIQALQLISGDLEWSDLFFNFNPVLTDLDVVGTGLRGNVFTTSGMPEAVTANAFDAGGQMLEMNEGVMSAMGVVILIPVNESVDLSTSPISGSGSGNGTTAITKLGNTPLDYTYEIAVSIPVSFQTPIPVTPAVTIDVTVTGTFSATGDDTITILPGLIPLSFTPGGQELEITGNVGANVILTRSGDFVTWTDVANLTLTAPVSVYTDATSIGVDRRFYLFRKP